MARWTRRTALHGGVGPRRVVPMDEIVAREFQAIRDLIAQNERARDAFDQAERERHAAEKVELDGRLNRMNEFRGALQDTIARFVQRPEFEEAKQAGIDRYEANRRHIEAANRSWWGTSLSLVASGIAAAWLIVGLKIDNTVAPLRVDTEQIRQVTTQNAERLRFTETATNASTQADTALRASEAQLNERVHQLEINSPIGTTTAAEVEALKRENATQNDRLIVLRNETVQQKAALVEIETQFCNGDYVRNLMHANELRVISLLWSKSFPDTHYPTDNAYYPRIGKCGGEGSGAG